ncbi:hypothetical protein V6N13_090714 [Hibiscus sabdariffa]
MPFRDWFAANLHDQCEFVSNRKDWSRVFVVWCWRLWKRQKEKIVSASIGYVRLLKDVDQRLPRDLVKAGSGHGVPIGWCKPWRGWVKLNVDGAVSLANGATTVGGVIRSNDGVWLFGFVRSQGRPWARAVRATAQGPRPRTPD